MTSYIFVLLVGLAGGCVSGIIGTGSSLMLLPVLVFTYGPKQAVPIMAVAAVMANATRIAVWWREVNWSAVAAYSITGGPAASLGAQTLLILPSHIIDIALGLFFLSMIPIRRWHAKNNFHLKLWQLSVAGAFIGFLTGIVLSTGPLSVPAFLSYGLSKGAFLSTEAASSLVLYISKVATFRELGALPLQTFLQGVIVGSSVMAGTFASKIIVMRMSTGAFNRALDWLMLCSGLSLLWAAILG